MKCSLTLLVAAAILFVSRTNAQPFLETFEGNSMPTCVTLTNTNTTTVSGEVIHGSKSLFSNPPVNGSGTRDYLSPYLRLDSTNISISYWYKLSERINAANSERFIEVGLQSATGTFISFDRITLTRDTPAQTEAKQQTIQITAPSTGAYRLVIRMGGDQGQGGARIIIDDIGINATNYYTNVCNTAPIAVDDNFSIIAVTSYSNNVITNTFGGSDHDDNGESFTASIVAGPASTSGTVVLNADGSFTFTPNASFTGGPVTFTYRLTDNGLAPAASNIATVTLNFPDLAPVVLPIKLLGFTGDIENQMAHLHWDVADNETGDWFQIYKSTDGRNYSLLATVGVSEKQGKEAYSYIDNNELKRTSYYKLKIINKDRSTSYSTVVVLKPGANHKEGNLSILKNPAHAVVYFAYTSSISTAANVRMYNAAGSKVYSSKVAIQKGINTINLRLEPSLAPGTYILEILDGLNRNTAKLLIK